MAFLNTQGNFYKPFANKVSDYTPSTIQVLQTAVSGSTSGALVILGSATAANNTHLLSLNLSVTDTTNTSQVIIMAGTDTIGALAAAGATTPASPLGIWSMNFGAFGLNIPSVITTSGLYLNIAAATSTVHAVATFWRNT